MATLEERVSKLEQRQARLHKWLKRIYRTLLMLSNNGVLPNDAAKVFKRERDELEGED